MTHHNWTNWTSDSACITVEAILACETQVHHNMSGNLASISLVTRPHHTHRTSQHHTNRTRDSGIVTDVVLACATPVLHQRFEKSNNTDRMSDSGFAIKAILPACATHVLCERFGKSNNTDPTTSDSNGFATGVVLAHESEKPVLHDSNLASISLMTRPHHTNRISDSVFATEAVPACGTPVLRERFGKSDLCDRIGNEKTICEGSVSLVTRRDSFFATEAVPACATPVFCKRFGKSDLCDKIGNERTICEGIVSSVTRSDSVFATEAVPACATPVFRERFGKRDLCDRIGNERTVCEGSVSSVTCQGNIVDKRGISPSSLSYPHTGLFGDWCDDEQLSSIYCEALLGTDKDYPRELDGVIPYNPCGDHHSDVEIFSKFLLDMDHDSCKEMITKLLSNQVIRQCVQEVLIETGLSQCAAPILSQAKFKQVPVSWLDCIQPYPVDELAFNKHHQGKKLGKQRTGHSNTYKKIRM